MFFFLSFLFSFFLTIFDYPQTSSCPQCQNLKINALMHLIALDKYSMWESYGSNKGMAFPISHAREKCICFKLTFSISQNASTSSLIHIIQEYLHNVSCASYNKYMALFLFFVHSYYTIGSIDISFFFSLSLLLAPSGALTAIPTYSDPAPTTFSDHTGPQHWTFTF